MSIALLTSPFGKSQSQRLDLHLHMCPARNTLPTRRRRDTNSTQRPDIKARYDLVWSFCLSSCFCDRSCDGCSVSIQVQAHETAKPVIMGIIRPRKAQAMRSAADSFDPTAAYGADKTATPVRVQTGQGRKPQAVTSHLEVVEERFDPLNTYRRRGESPAAQTQIPRVLGVIR